MTLTLEEVQRIRFRMERRSPGYNVTDVDTFVDKVEATFSQMNQETDLLRKQLESLDTSQHEGFAAPGANNSGEISRLEAEVAELRNQLAQRDGGSQDKSDRIAQLAAENAELRRELDSARRQSAQAAQAFAASSHDGGGVEHLVVTTSDEASPVVIRLVQLATEQAEQVVAEADSEARRKVEEANQKAFEITTDARTKADRIESEARVNADTMTTQAANRAAQVDEDAKKRRAELFSALESERDDLSAKVGNLRGFESSYRENLVSQLQRQLDQLHNSQFEPTEVPELAERREGDTPRLDALMHEQH